MTNRTAQQDIASEGIVTLDALQAAEVLRRRGDIRNGVVESWLRKVIEHWHRSFSAQPGEEFRTDESVREQHFLASLPKDDWRVPYGVDGYAGWQMMREIERRRNYGISLEGLEWPRSDDPYAPSNNPNHPYYIPKEGAS